MGRFGVTYSVERDLGRGEEPANDRNGAGRGEEPANDHNGAGRGGQPAHELRGEQPAHELRGKQPAHELRGEQPAIPSSHPDLHEVSALETGIQLEESGSNGKKRGRPFAWAPALLSKEDESEAVRLARKYGPDEEGLKSFQERYLTFCKINKKNPLAREALLDCVAQARLQGMAASSIHTYIEGLTRSLKIEGAWFVRAVCGLAHADATPVNPRTTEWNEALLFKSVEESEGPDQLLLWMLLATGARPADIEKLSFQQVRVEKEGLRVSWWVRKAQRKRRERHEEVYPFAWSMPPPNVVRVYLHEGKATHGLFPLDPKYNARRIAATATSILKMFDESLTSYVFRDRMEMILQLQNVPATEIKRLLDHDAQTSAASYQKTPLASATAARVRNEKATLRKRNEEK
jgi:integrase